MTISPSDLDFDPDRIDIPTGHFIGGSLIDTQEARIEVRRPSDGAIMGTIPGATPETVERAVLDAKRAFKATQWSCCSPRDRARLLQRWADLMMENRLPLARLEAAGSTRPVAECFGTDVPYAAETIRFFAEFADKVDGDVMSTRGDHLGLLVPEPYGVIGAIAPWNFPLTMAMWKCAPALAAGNAVVLKPSELTPFSILRVAQLAIDAGLPAGVFNIVQGNGTGAGAALVRHPDIAKISFTGSTATGATIMSEAARHGIKPVTLELGGKSPQLVFEDAGDIPAVARRISKSIIGNAGQVCVAGSRIIAQKGVVDELVHVLVGLLNEPLPAHTWSGRAAYSPIVSVRQADRVERLVDETLKQGAELLTGGSRFEGMNDGIFYRPTLLTSVSSEMAAVREEVFGPVLTLQSFEDIEEGIAMAEHAVYGLAAGVHTRDLATAMHVMRRIPAGTVWINRYGRSLDFNIPTGGFKGSGFGKDLGRAAMEANLRYKSVLMSFAEPGDVG